MRLVTVEDQQLVFDINLVGDTGAEELAANMVADNGDEEAVANNVAGKGSTARGSGRRSAPAQLVAAAGAHDCPAIDSAQAQKNTSRAQTTRSPARSSTPQNAYTNRLA